jgi:hypothetical protein
MLFPQGQRDDLRAQRAGQSPDLHVIRQHNDDFIARFDPTAHGQKIRFGGAVSYQHIFRIRAGIELGDGFLELRAAVGLSIAEFLVEKFLERNIVAEHFAQGHGMDAAFRQVVLNAVLPQRLQALHLERFDSHGWATR